MFISYLEKTVYEEEWDQLLDLNDQGVVSIVPGKSEKVITVMRDLTVFESIATFFQLLGQAIRSVFCKETPEEKRQWQLAEQAFIEGKSKWQVELIENLMANLLHDMQREILEYLPPKDIEALRFINTWRSKSSELFLWKLKAKQLGCPLRSEGRNQAESVKKQVKEYIQDIRKRARAIQSDGLDLLSIFDFPEEVETLCSSDKIEDIVELRDWINDVHIARDTVMVQDRIARCIEVNIPPISSFKELLEAADGFDAWCTLYPARLSMVRSLTLESLSLRSLPKAINRLSNLRTLNLEFNQFSTFPRQVCEIKSLRSLDLSYNYISKLPFEIQELTNLEVLNLKNNRISSLPPQIGKLTSLSRLKLDGNQISVLPLEIYDLTQLKTLSLDGSRIAHLDADIAKMRSLEKLFLSGSEISELPKEMSQLPHLRQLYLDFTKISTIPQEIYQMPGLTIFGAVVAQVKHLFAI